jgi:hypothetical protein
MAATTGPAPNTPVAGVPDPGRHRKPLLGVAHLGADAAQVGGKFSGELAAG